VPAERMKAGRPHRVPLSAGAIAIVKALPKIDNNDYLFPSVQHGKAISDMTLTAVIRRMNEVSEMPNWVDPITGREVVPHGFRSTFRDWAAQATTFPSEMAEMALAHAVGSKVEAAYRRGDMFERRREMMEAWANQCAA
jgi:integrase